LGGSSKTRGCTATRPNKGERKAKKKETTSERGQRKRKKIKIHTEGEKKGRLATL